MKLMFVALFLTIWNCLMWVVFSGIARELMKKAVLHWLYYVGGVLRAKFRVGDERPMAWPLVLFGNVLELVDASFPYSFIFVCSCVGLVIGIPCFFVWH